MGYASAAFACYKYAADKDSGPVQYGRLTVYPSAGRSGAGLAGSIPGGSRQAARSISSTFRLFMYRNSFLLCSGFLIHPNF